MVLELAIYEEDKLDAHSLAMTVSGLHGYGRVWRPQPQIGR